MNLVAAAALAMPALAVAGAIVWNPFAGLVALVGLAQLGGLIRAAAPTSGDLALEGIAALVILGVVLQSWREPREARLGRDSLALRLAIIFLLALVLSFLFAAYKDAALDAMRRRINLLLLFFLILRLANTVRRVEILVMAVLVSTAISGGAAVLGYAAGIQLVPASDAVAAADQDPGLRQTGAASAGPNAAAHALIAGGCIATVLTLRRRRGKAWYAGVIALAVAGVVLSFSRSMAIIACLTSVALLLNNARSRRFPQIVLVGALVVALILPLIPQPYWDRLSTLEDPGQDYTLSRRLGYHLVGLDLLLTHPLLGVGPGNFPSYYTSTEYRWMPSRTLTPRALHDMYLSVTVETGFVGIACFCALLLVCLLGAKRVWKASPDADARALGEALFFSLAAYLFGCVFSPAETAKYTWILPALCAALASAAFPQESRKALVLIARSHPDATLSVQRNS
jgi:O-antigen ligase